MSSGFLHPASSSRHGSYSALRPWFWWSVLGPRKLKPAVSLPPFPRVTLGLQPICSCSKVCKELPFIDNLINTSRDHQSPSSTVQRPLKRFYFPIPIGRYSVCLHRGSAASTASHLLYLLLLMACCTWQADVRPASTRMSHGTKPALYDPTP